MGLFVAGKIESSNLLPILAENIALTVISASEKVPNGRAQLFLSYKQGGQESF